MAACAEQLENTRVQLENAKAEVQKPFTQEEELAAKTARLNELNALLNLDKTENEIVDGERGEEDWKSETYLSLAGVFQTKRENVVSVALSRFLDEHPSVRKIHLHLDNDAVGRGAVKGIVGGLQGKYQVYDEPPAHGKDVNDELKIRVGLMRERKERERT